jgi:uncharacterized protein YecE (DUF72 family)
LAFAQGERLGLINLRLGTIGWSYSFWKGNFYPDKTAPSGFLAYYASRFNSVEVDSTFYRIPSPQTILNWKKQVPDDFKFSLKFPQAITHLKKLKNAQRETGLFLERAELLGKKLGALLIQFPPEFAASHMQDLAVFLSALPKKFRYAVEVRNKSWLNPDFYGFLKDSDAALVWADSPLMANVGEVTADFLYVRWEGDRKAVNGTLGKVEVDKTADLKVQAQRIQPHLDRGTAVFGYFAKYYSGYPPSDIPILKNLIGVKTQNVLGQCRIDAYE